MEVTAFHRNLIRSSLWPYSSPRGVRPLAGILLYGARTFLSHLRGSGCLIGFPTGIIKPLPGQRGTRNRTMTSVTWFNDRSQPAIEKGVR